MSEASLAQQKRRLLSPCHIENIRIDAGISSSVTGDDPQH
jgi:hypothetical protein